MLLLTRLDGKQILLNEKNIELIEETPDTIITLVNGHAYIVKESIEEIMKNLFDFHQKLNSRKRYKRHFTERVNNSNDE